MALQRNNVMMKRTSSAKANWVVHDPHRPSDTLGEAILRTPKYGDLIYICASQIFLVVFGEEPIISPDGNSSEGVKSKQSKRQLYRGVSSELPNILRARFVIDFQVFYCHVLCPDSMLH